MKKFNLLLMIAVVAMASILSSCKKEEDITLPEPPPVEEEPKDTTTVDTTTVIDTAVTIPKQNFTADVEYEMGELLDQFRVEMVSRPSNEDPDSTFTRVTEAGSETLKVSTAISFDALILEYKNSYTNNNVSEFVSNIDWNTSDPLMGTSNQSMADALQSYRDSWLITTDSIATSIALSIYQTSVKETYITECENIRSSGKM
ncbi:MAG: hypothetical protein OEX08_02495 [Candidatus Nomurabacteria bacterium]|nr:hypothetical protein [Candidatus Nomurabacteria bacterium]